MADAPTLKIVKPLVVGAPAPEEPFREPALPPPLPQAPTHRASRGRRRRLPPVIRPLSTPKRPSPAAASQPDAEVPVPSAAAAALIAALNAPTLPLLAAANATASAVAAPLPGAESAGERPPAREPSPEPEVAPPPIPLDRVATPIPLARWLVPIPLAAAVTPIRLSTPIPVSPPFAAVSVAAPLAAPAIGPVADPAPRAARPTEADLFLDEETRFTGDVLRRVREARGLTVQQLCERTKITRRHIENLEADRYEKLPAVVYLRGFLVVISKELRLDGQKVARSYLDAIAASSTPPLTTSRR